MSKFVSWHQIKVLEKNLFVTVGRKKKKSNPTIKDGCCNDFLLNDMKDITL